MFFTRILESSAMALHVRNCMLALLGVAVVILPGAASAQEDTTTSRSVRGQQQASGSDVILNQVDTSAYPKVTIFATVLKDGEPQKGLTSSDFSVREDEVDQEPLTVEPKLSPLSAVVVLDTSGSMRKSLNTAIAAAQSFIDTLQPEDQVQVMAFARSVKTLSPMSTTKTAASASFSAAVARGDTALYDAIYSSVEALAGKAGRKAIVVLSDGVDDDGYGKQLSQKSVADVLAIAEEVNVPVFTIGLGSKIDEAVLRRVASSSGAKYYNAPKAEDLAALYQSISKQLSGQYNIFYTSNLPADGTLRTIQLAQGDARGAKSYKAPSGGAAPMRVAAPAPTPLRTVQKGACPTPITTASFPEDAPLVPLNVGCEIVVPEASLKKGEFSYVAFNVASGRRVSAVLELAKQKYKGSIYAKVELLYPSQSGFSSQHEGGSIYRLVAVSNAETAGKWFLRFPPQVVSGKIGLYEQDISDAGSGKDAGESEGNALEVAEGTSYSGMLAKKSDKRDLYLFSLKPNTKYQFKVRPASSASVEVVLYDENGAKLAKATSSNEGAGVTLNYETKDATFGSLAINTHYTSDEYYRPYSFIFGPSGFRPPRQPDAFVNKSPKEIR